MDSRRTEAANVTSTNRSIKPIFLINILASSTLVAGLFSVLSGFEILREVSLYGQFARLSIESHFGHAAGAESIDEHVDSYIKKSAQNLDLPQPNIVALIDPSGYFISTNIKPWVNTDAQLNTSFQRVYANNRKVLKALDCHIKNCPEVNSKSEGLNLTSDSVTYTASIPINNAIMSHSHSQLNRKGDYLLLVNFKTSDLISEITIIIALSLVISTALMSIISIAPYIYITQRTIPRFYSSLQHDPMTGLFNRSIFTELAIELLSEGELENTEFVFVLFDIDDFKSINDAHGHAAGDQVLRELSLIINNLVRQKTDLSCRFGGEEFALLLKCSQHDALHILERLRYQIENHTCTYEKHKISTTVSIGATSTKNQGFNFDYLAKQADIAMYNAKSTGKNNIKWQWIDP